MAPLGLSFSLLIEAQGLIKVNWSESLAHLILISLCCVLGLCHSFKSCALPLSLLLHTHRNHYSSKMTIKVKKWVMAQFLEILIPSSRFREYSSHSLAYEITNPCNNWCRKHGSIPGSGRYPVEENGNSLQFSCLDNAMDRRAWWTTVYGKCKETWFSMSIQIDKNERSHTHTH